MISPDEEIENADWLKRAMKKNKPQNRSRGEITKRVDLWGVTPGLEGMAIDALFKRDAFGFLIRGDNLYGLSRVLLNRDLLKDLGIFEETLLHAYQGTRINNSNFPKRDLDRLFVLADCDRLRACGEPIPHAGPFTLYRGVAGHGPARRVRGISWTGNVETAQWFADRAKVMGLADAAVYQVTIPIDCILAYLNERKEDEYLIALSPSIKPERLRARERGRGWSKTRGEK